MMDHFVYLHSVSARAGTAILKALACLSRPNYIVHLEVPPELARARKLEWDLDYLNGEIASRNKVLEALRVPTFVLNGAAPQPWLGAAVLELIRLLRQLDFRNPEALAIFDVLLPEARARLGRLLTVLRVADGRIAQFAKRNRLMHALVAADRARFGPFHAQAAACEKIVLAARSESYLREILSATRSKALLIKRYLDSAVPNIGSDVDVSVPSSDASQVLEALRRDGRLERVEQNKWTWRKQGFADLDLYLNGAWDGGLQFVREEFLWAGAKPFGENLYLPAPDVQLILLIAHSAHETGVMTLFDLLQLAHRALSNSVDWSSLEGEADLCGWGEVFREWVGTAGVIVKALTGREVVPARVTGRVSDVRFPYLLSLRTITAVWWRMALSSGTGTHFKRWGELAAKTVRAIRVWRVRMLGRIPFHDFDP
jgi:hypothetical protein